MESSVGTIHQMSLTKPTKSPRNTWVHFEKVIRHVALKQGVDVGDFDQLLWKKPRWP
jgi:thermostable 8-oxoguanine DNA glycosylase